MPGRKRPTDPLVNSTTAGPLGSPFARRRRFGALRGKIDRRHDGHLKPREPTQPQPPPHPAQMGKLQTLGADRLDLACGLSATSPAPS